MYAVINPDTFADAIGGVAQLVDEAVIEVSSEGMETSAVDASNVGMVEMGLDANAFTTLTEDNESLGVNINRFASTVSRLQSELVEDDAERELHIKLDENTHRLKLWCEPGTMTYSLSLIDPDSIREKPNIPDINVASTIELRGEYFDNIVKTASGTFDHMIVGTDNDTVVFNCEGDIDDFNVEATEADYGIYSINAGDVESIYSLNYFDDIRKGLPSDETVTIEVGNDFPITIKSTYDDENIDITYMIAPRVEDGN